jgi:hypothetical protein
MSYSVVISPAAAANIKGTATAVVLQSRNPSFDGETTKTVDVYSGPSAAVLEMFDDYFPKKGVLDIKTDDGAAGKKTLTIIWNLPPSEIAAGADEEKPQWSVEPIEVVRGLAAHPYFQLAYAPGSGELALDRISEADYAMSRGMPYIAKGVYQDWTKRYYGLKMAGVDGFPVYGLSITKSFKTDSAADLSAAFENAGISVALGDIGMPAAESSAAEQLQRISGYTSSNPGSFQLAPTQWEFVQRPPRFSGPEGGPWQVSVEWIGLDQYSTVLYPGGTWDPEGATA